jgi:L-threonylcarbamoyladenylate synthase
LTEVAHNLYSVLRRVDAAGYRRMHVEPVTAEAGGLATAINDRLRRAAAKR